ncbi:hypothetical protein [Streptomyces sp. NPDC057287]|uniref:hypothetical protein n=1 Tax=Streptomyces sp. NPDC057287 TaxID=3346086 RepID=UPI00363A2D79
MDAAAVIIVGVGPAGLDPVCAGLAGMRPDSRRSGAGSDTRHDVRFDHGTPVMPGVRVGRAVIASGSVVDDGAVGGNPALLLRHRGAGVDRLLTPAWRYRPLPHITEHARTMISGTVDGVEAATAGPSSR